MIRFGCNQIRFSKPEKENITSSSVIRRIGMEYSIRVMEFPNHRKLTRPPYIFNILLPCFITIDTYIRVLHLQGSFLLRCKIFVPPRKVNFQVTLLNTLSWHIGRSIEFTEESCVVATVKACVKKRVQELSRHKLRLLPVIGGILTLKTRLLSPQLPPKVRALAVSIRTILSCYTQRPRIVLN